MIKAKTSEIVQYQIPEHLRESNPNLIKFLQYYYAWSEQSGEALDFLSNMLQYKDIDTASELFATLTAKQFLKSIPATAIVDKKLLVKNIKQFFLAKGSYPSYEFLMNALFGEAVSQEWMSQYVLRASANEWIKTVNVVVRATSGDFTKVVGSKVIQSNPVAFGYVIDKSTVVVNNETLIVLKLEHSKIINEFQPYKTLKVLKNDVVDRDSTLDSDYYFGEVIPCQSTIDLVNSGAIYSTGQSIKFVGGSGYDGEAVISETSTGSVDQIEVLEAGSGYAIGDLITTNSIDFSAQVTKLDGYGGTLTPTMELNSYHIRNAGYNFAVGDIVEARYMRRNTDVPPIQFAVASVNSTWNLDNVIIENPGLGYSYVNLVLHNETTDTLVANFSAAAKVGSGETVSAIMASTTSQLQSIYDIELIDAGVLTLADNVYKVHANGFGAVVNVTLALGSLDTVTMDNQGWNYQDPVVEIVGDGDGAVVKLNTAGGRITSIDIVKVGFNYTQMQITVRERFGSGAVLTPIIRNQTDALGYVTALTILNRGELVGTLESYEVPLQTVTGVGQSLKVDLDYRIKNAALVESGQRYRDVSIDTNSGRGTGAVLVPVIESGVITAVNVLDSGSGYPSNSQVTFFSSDTVDDCVLSPTILNGRIISVDVTDGGSGYVSTHDNKLSTETTGEFLKTEAGEFLWFVSNEDQLVISNGVNDKPAIITTDIGENGIVISAHIAEAGSGLKDPSELHPLTISVSSVYGKGAILKPVLENGVLIHIFVVYPGSGYQSGDAVVISGGNGTLASATCTVVGGKVLSATVTAGGSGYSYGTKAYVLGDGTGAELDLQVNTGITSVEIINGGTGYVTPPTLTVVDPDGSGAELRAEVENGAISRVEIINAGSGYTNPTITLGSGQILLEAKRYLNSVVVKNSGVNYKEVEIYIQSDSTDVPVIHCTVQKFAAGLTNVDVVDAGGGYTSMPTLVATDISGVNSISEVEIINKGSDFRELPVLKVNSLTGTGARVLALSDTIGRCLSTSFSTIGIGYDEISKISFPTNVILNESDSPFKLGEQLIRVNDVLFDNPVGKVHSFDWAKNYLKIDDIGVELFFITENDQPISTEDGFTIVDEQHQRLKIGDTIQGMTSGAKATIKKIYKAAGFTKQSGTNRYNYRYKSDAGKPNVKTMRIHNSERFQDFAYVLKTSITMDQYETFIRETIHPAGYGMFGLVDLVEGDALPLMKLPDEQESIENEAIVINLALEPAEIPYQRYEFVDFNKWNYSNTPAMVFGHLIPAQINTIEKADLLLEDGFKLLTEDGADILEHFAKVDPIYNERLMIGRAESESTTNITYSDPFMQPDMIQLGDSIL